MPFSEIETAKSVGGLFRSRAAFEPRRQSGLYYRTERHDVTLFPHCSGLRRLVWGKKGARAGMLRNGFLSAAVSPKSPPFPIRTRIGRRQIKSSTVVKSGTGEVLPLASASVRGA